jgi:SanA protein
MDSWLVDPVKPKLSIWQRWLRAIVLAIFSGLTIVVLAILSIDLWISLQARERLATQVQALRPATYGVVLGTAKYYSTGINPFYEARMNATAELYHSGLVEQIIASGDHSTPFYNEPGMMLDDLVLLGVPEQVILRDGGGIRTLNSVRRLESEFGQTDVIIVSQRFHLERALYLARAAGISAQGFIAEDPPLHWYWRIRVREIFARLSAVIDIYLLERIEFD